MHPSRPASPRSRGRFASCRGPALCCAAALVCGALAGCAAVSNPVADAIPVRYLPPEVLGERKADLQPIPLNMLRQKQPDFYRLGPGDVLGVFIEGVLGEPTLPVPVTVPLNANAPPSLGYPLPVRDDGTLPLPLVGPLKVEGMTLTQAQEALVRAYTIDRKLLKPGRERIIVTLQRPRQYHVLVVRQDSAAPQGGSVSGGGNAQFVFGTVGSGAILGQIRRGAGYAIDLPAYENDVLNALARTGGLPGTDAKNEVIILRGAYTAATLAAFANCPDPAALLAPGAPGLPGAPQSIRIPLRLRPGSAPSFRPEDVILRAGDILFIEARNTEVFYTGGLLPARQFILPRDYDLDVLQAVAAVAGPLVNGAINFNNLSGSIQTPGLGFPSPSQVTVLRRTPTGGQIPIKVSLNRALRDPRERILVQPGDFLILQQTMGEALAQYTISNLRFNLFSTFVNNSHLQFTNTYSFPGP